MKISILVPDLSGNCLGRGYTLARMLQRRYEVEIVGPLFGKEIWFPLKNDKKVPFKFVKLDRGIKFFKILSLLKKIDGDVLYASKPFFTSFGLGLLKKILSKRPLVLDIDDWQMGFIKDKLRHLRFSQTIKFFIISFIRFYEMGSFWNNFLFEKFIKLSDRITVSNQFLQQKFGGVVIYHARDANDFNPQRFNKEELRKKYGIEKDKKIVLFFGTIRPHKGVEDLIKGVSLIKNSDLVLIVGAVKEDGYSQTITKLGKKLLGEKRFKAFGEKPFSEFIELLSLTDVMVIPQRYTFFSQGQTPAKIFDAMAMAKPIIATKVSDIPYVLKGCGILINPSAPQELAREIKNLLHHPEEMKNLGEMARKRFIKRYSFDAVSKVLLNLFKEYEDEKFPTK